MKDDNRTELEKRIDNEIISFRKNGNITLLNTAQLIKAALLNNNHSDKKITEIEVLQRMIKEREKSIEAYKKANRNDLAHTEASEITYIKEFLPKEPSEAELETSIKCWINNYKDVMTIDMKCTKLIVNSILDEYPTAQKSTIVKIFKSLL